jgi:large subunit ribosomal protein L9
MPTQVILLERVEKLGAMGDVVAVKPGYARNYLLPQSKALRATKENIAYYEAQKAHLQKANSERKAEAEKMAKAVEVVLVRQAAEAGQLFGSVTSRDIAEALANESKQPVTRGMVTLNQNFKTIGLFPVDVVLHPEVKVKIIVNVARSADEAAIQAKTGKAVVADGRGEKRGAANLDDAKSAMLEDGAIAAEAAQADEAAKAQAEADEKAAKKAAKKSKKDDAVDGEEVAA